ncbi:MAG: lipoate--protein ligase family protein [Candidatus Kariarchaeaceae archaeon]|jgi:lipoyltransferase/lipoate-protein ligase
MRIRHWNSDSTDPVVNLARDHFLLEMSSRKREDGIIRFWKNTKSVILGRTQELEVEVNQEFCSKNNIRILRRVSGGGAVYHDQGNLNISIILPLGMIPGKRDIQSISVKFTQLIAESLRETSYEDISIYKDTSILYRGRKISGSAGHLTRGWFLHHATMLIDSDLEMLNGSLLARDPDPEDLRRSRYYPTQNLDNLNLDLWKTSLLQKVTSTVNATLMESKLQEDERTLSQLYEKLYRSENWTKKGKREFVAIDWDNY